MIKVSRSSVTPPPGFFKQVETAKARLKEFFDIPLMERIQRYPRFDDQVWKDSRQLLFKVFNGKCGYCETPILGYSGEVELFRPKVGAIGLTRDDKSPDHYWWVAYEWENLYLACRDCNFNKASKFPVIGARAEIGAPLNVIRQVEKPLLLDPCEDIPEDHLGFADSGMVSPLSDRGRATIEILNLNRSSLVSSRLKELHDTKDRVTLMFAANRYSPSALDELLSLEKPFAAARRQVIHRFVREKLGDFAPALGDEDKDEALKQVEKESKFISSAEQSNIDEDFAQKRKAQERAPVKGDLSNAFLLQKTQYITKIRLHNFRVIEDLTLELPPPQGDKKPWLILLGENGQGKSSILKAVALALMGRENYHALKLRPESFLRRGTDEGLVEVFLTGYSEPFRLELRKGDKKFRTNEPNLHTLFCCYGGTRLLPTGKRRPRSVPDDYARINNLFDPFLPLIDAKSWLLGLDDNRFGFSARAIKKLLTEDERRDLDRVPREKPREVVLKTSSGSVASPGETTFKENRSGEATLESLSDGYQSVIALASDILEVMLQYYSEVQDSEGIVLIDEIDVHLHPRWKVEIVNLLRDVFPRVQFLVTTHDPLCLMGSRPGEVQVLYKNPETRRVQAQQVDVPPGTTADQILTGFWFGLRSTMDQDTLTKLDRHRQLLRERRPESDPERLQIEAELRQRLGTFADTSVDRMAQSVASQVIQETSEVLTPEARAEMRKNIREKLLQGLNEGGTA